MCQWLHLHLQNTHNDQPLPLNTVALIFLFKDKHLSPFSFKMPTLPATLPARLQHTFFKMENSQSIMCLDRLFLHSNTTVYRMNYWVHAARRHRATCVLGRVHAGFCTNYQIEEMVFIPKEIILVRLMSVLDLEFEKAMHYHDEGYEIDNHYGSHSEAPTLKQISWPWT